jgi:maltose alpha-D-glucosyltransferase/alpha-amylase
MAFWLKLGVAGFRVDAATLMIQNKDPEVPKMDDPHAILREMKRVAVRHRGDAILLAEADDDPAELAIYFGTDGDEMDLLLNFVLNAHLMHALAVERAGPVVDGLDRLPDPPKHGRWANFLRNYDELNIGRLRDEDRLEVFKRFAPEEGMRIYGRGIRRRLAPILDGDRSRIELALSLLFSMPGVPLVVYGDEIGMGDHLSLPGRTAVRTPMQWSDERNAGFSTAPTESLVRPVVDDGEFDYRRVNVAAQRANPESLLNWTERLIATRHECPEVGTHDYEVLDTADESVLAMRYPGDGGAVVVVHNLASEAKTVEVDTGPTSRRSVNHLVGDAELVGNGVGEIALDGYDCGWYRIGRPQ